MPERADIAKLHALLAEHHRTAFMDRETRSRAFWEMQDAAGRALPSLLDELDTLRAGSGALAALYRGDQEGAINALEALPDPELERFARLAGDLSTIADDCLGRRHG